MTLIQAFVWNMGSPCCMISEKLKWIIFTRQIVAKATRMADDAVVVMKPL
ncbi:MAG: hypothetical protein WC756_12990 [Taibaiella sp.]|jgi:hypothetical protein